MTDYGSWGRIEEEIRDWKLESGKWVMTEKKVVFSTKTGDQRKKQPPSTTPSVSLPAQQQTLKVMRERKGRKGKTVTIISGFVLTEADLKTLTKTLKNLCGAGGTAKNEPDGQTIEVQGDHREKITETLKELGYKVKLAGG